MFIVSRGFVDLLGGLPWSGLTPVGLEGLGWAWLGLSPCAVALQKASLASVSGGEGLPPMTGDKPKVQAFIEILAADSFMMVLLAQTRWLDQELWEETTQGWGHRQRNHGSHPTLRSKALSSVLPPLLWQSGEPCPPWCGGGGNVGRSLPRRRRRKRCW